MDIAVCDDQPIFIETFFGQLSEYFEEKKLPFHLTSFSNGTKFLQSALDYDIVFMDIKMDGLSGMEAARMFRKVNSATRLVFLTAYREYVFEAFDVDASDYLLKPVCKEKLFQVLDRLIQKLLEMRSRTLLIQNREGRFRIPLHQVDYLEVMDRQISVHTKDEIYTFYGKLEVLERQLPANFFRCHRSFLVNLDSVMRYDKTSVKLASGTRLPLSKRRYQDFTNAFFASLRREKIQDDI